MSTPLETAAKVTGWDPSVISYLYDEFIAAEDDNFFDFLGEHVGVAAFVIAASNGLGIDVCLQAFDHGFESVVNEDFDVDAAIDSILFEDDQLTVEK